jgi:hypothetical protein
MTVSMVTRNASLEDLATLLEKQQGEKFDRVVSASALRARGGKIVLKDAVESMDLDRGVGLVDAVLTPTEIFDEGVADKLKIGLPYVRRMRAEAPDLWDVNVNGWLHGKRVTRGGETEIVRPGMTKKFLVRSFVDTSTGEGVARALLSDRYKVTDNLDVLTAVLEGVKASGIDAQVVSADLTDRKMYVRVAAPSVTALAPTLLQGYRSPWMDPAENAKRRHDGGATVLDDGGTALPIVFAGFDIRNSETGSGKFAIKPVITVLVCNNGMTLDSESKLEQVHLGRQMDEGTIDWSEETRQANVALVRSQTNDAVRSFLSPAWLEREIKAIDEKAGAPVGEPEKVLEEVSKKLSYSEGERLGILAHFIRGGQMTAGGVLNAVTSFSQTVPNPDRSHELEDSALRALDLVASR